MDYNIFNPYNPRDPRHEIFRRQAEVIWNSITGGRALANPRVDPDKTIRELELSAKLGIPVKITK